MQNITLIKTHLENETRIQERFGFQVPTCCSMEGYVDIGTCKGTNRQVWDEEFLTEQYYEMLKGEQMRVTRMMVCHDHINNDGIHHPADRVSEVQK